MLFKLFRLVFGLLCGYLVVQWIPMNLPFHAESFFSEFILNPLEFLAGAIALIMGMLSLGGLIREGIISAIRFLKREQGRVLDLIMGIGSVGVFLTIRFFGEEQALVFFCFSLLYGMISLVHYRKDDT